MSVVDGQNVNANVTNNAFMSRLVNTSTVGVVDLNNTSDPNSGAQITNAQQFINEIAASVGNDGIGSLTNNDYTSTNVVANGQDRRAAISAIDAKFTNISVGELTDVDLTGIVAGQILKWNGASFVAAADDTGGGGGATELNDLTDVTIAGAADNDIIRRVGGVFVNDPGPAGDILGTTDSQTLTNKTIDASNNTVTISSNQISDINSSGITDGQILIWNNGAGEFQPGNQAALGSINGLSDVDTVTNPPSVNDVLTWTGTQWEPQAGGGGAPSITAEGMHYARINGSAGGAAVVQGESQAGSFTVTQVSTGVFDVDYSALSLTNTPAIVVSVVADGATSDEIGVYKVTESNLGCRIRCHANRVPADLNFSIITCPVGSDAVVQSVQTVYAAKVNAAGTVLTDNVPGWLTSALKVGLVYKVINSVGFTDVPITFASYLDGASGTDDRKIMGQFRDTTEAQFQINAFVGGNVGDSYDYDVICIPMDADDGETVVGASKWFSARSDQISGVTNENISGFFNSVNFSTPNYTWDWTGNLIETPAFIGLGNNPFNGGDGSSRFTSNVSVGPNGLVQSQGNANALQATNGFSNSQILVLPCGADSRF